MPFAKRSGSGSQIDQKLKMRRQKIIEEERIRVLRESLMLFYDKLMEQYELIHPRYEDSDPEDSDNESESVDIIGVKRKEVEALVGEYANTKPIGF